MLSQNFWKPQFSLRAPSDAASWNIYHGIRKKELFDPAGINYDRNHFTITHPKHQHYLFYLNNTPVGVAHIEKLEENDWAVRTIAINEGCRLNGYGSILLSLVDKKIASLGGQTIFLHSTSEAVEFYQKNGYRETKCFNNASILADAVDMEKSLPLSLIARRAQNYNSRSVMLIARRETGNNKYRNTTSKIQLKTHLSNFKMPLDKAHEKTDALKDLRAQVYLTARGEAIKNKNRNNCSVLFFGSTAISQVESLTLRVK